MAARPPAWMLALLITALATQPGSAQTSEAREKLCGHRFVRAVVRACGGPRWSPEAGKPAAGGDRELYQWQERRHLVPGLEAEGDPAPGPGRQPLPQDSHRHRGRRAAADNPAHRCCLLGCTQRDLLYFCPH